jgi:type VI protein secretion system component VasA
MKKNALLTSIDVSSRRKRRAATNIVIELLIKIRFAEQEHLSRMPLHFYGNADYIAAEDTIDTLIAATVALSEAYYYPGDQ